MSWAVTSFTETITSTPAVTRFFDDANRLEISVQDGMTTTYTYDDNGNLTTIDPPGASGTTRYGYDQRSLMITSTVDGSAVASFSYDGMNNRLRQVDFTGATVITTTYANDILGLSQVLIADDGTNQVVNLFGLDLILQDDGTGALALLSDGLGSVRLEMVGSEVEATTTYSPYGKELAQEGDSATVYGYTGEQEDNSTGLLYLRARYYSSYQNLAGQLLNDTANIEYVAANLEAGALRALSLGFSPTAFNSASWHLRGLQTDEEIAKSRWNPGGAVYILDDIPTALSVLGLTSNWNAYMDPQYVRYRSS